jgi:hypothetical protein
LNKCRDLPKHLQAKEVMNIISAIDDIQERKSTVRNLNLLHNQLADVHK